MIIGIDYYNDSIDAEEVFGSEYLGDAYDMQINIENLKEIILEKIYNLERKDEFWKDRN